MSEGSRTMDAMRELGMSLGQPMIAVVGCGGAGNNIVDSIYWQCHGVQTIVVNTDQKTLDRVNAHKKIRLGADGQDGGYQLPECEKLAEESSFAIRRALEGYDIVFVVAGLGGAAGSGSAPVIARIAREEGATVFAVPVLPFAVEADRKEIAAIALEQLEDVAHCTIPLDNEKLCQLCGNEGLSTAFRVIDQMILKIINRIYEHSSSYVSDLIDDVSFGYETMEEIATAEHEIVLEEMPVMAAQANIMPSMEFPFDQSNSWNDMMFG
jgi:cell division protein FtsZ